MRGIRAIDAQLKEVGQKITDLEHALCEQKFVKTKLQNERQQAEIQQQKDIKNKEEEALQQRIAQLQAQLDAQHTIEEDEEPIEELDEEERERQEQLEQLKRKHKWSKPSWAQKKTASEAVEVHQQNPDNQLAVDSKKAADARFKFSKPSWAAGAGTIEEVSGSGGYQRRVKPQQINLVQGHAVAKSYGKEPRMCWVVINVGGKKVGKIVMHLYGKQVDHLVNQFIDLKGSQVAVEARKPLQVLGCSPKFWITTNSPKDLDSKMDVYGVVVEGQDVAQQVRELAEDGDGNVEIRQAHIYPVKTAAS